MAGTEKKKEVVIEVKGLVNAFGEMIHNACRHAFPEGRDGPRRTR